MIYYSSRSQWQKSIQALVPCVFLIFLNLISDLINLSFVDTLKFTIEINYIAKVNFDLFLCIPLIIIDIAIGSVKTNIYITSVCQPRNRKKINVSIIIMVFFIVLHHFSDIKYSYEYSVSPRHHVSSLLNRLEIKSTCYVASN